MTKQRSLVYALDLGGTSTKAAVLDLKTGQVLDKWQFFMGYGDKIVVNFAAHFKKRLNLHNWHENQFKAVGLVIKCPYDKKRGLAVRAVGIGWTDYPILRAMQAAFPFCPIFICNDATGALLGEWKHGVGQKYSSLLYVIIGRGVGGGILLDNKIWDGAHNLSGEIGHGGDMQTIYKCGCPSRGNCTEGSSSAYAMEKAFSDYASEHPNSRIASYWKSGEKRIALKDIAPLIKIRDLTTMKIFNKCLRPLAARISMAIFMLDVEAVIIGGGITALGDHLLEPLWKMVRQYLWPTFQKGVVLKVATLGNDAGFYGAFALAKQGLETSKDG